MSVTGDLHRNTIIKNERGCQRILDRSRFHSEYAGQGGMLINLISEMSVINLGWLK